MSIITCFNLIIINIISLGEEYTDYEIQKGDG